MFTLKPDHIEQLRNYFLADKSKRKAVQDSFIQAELTNLASELLRIFIHDPFNEGIFNSLSEKYGLAGDTAIFKELQYEYYDKLASEQIKGISNDETGQMMTTGNMAFIHTVRYHQDLINALRSSEREKLKNHFRELDSNYKAKESEYVHAVQPIEPVKIKGRHAGKKISISIARYIAAASLIGILIFGTYFFFFRQKGIYNSETIAKLEKELDLFEKQNNIKDKIQVLEIHPASNNITTNAELEKVIIRNVNTLIAAIGFKLSYLRSDSVNHLTDDMKQIKIDSLVTLHEYLTSIANSYTYDAETETVVLNSTTADSVAGVYRYAGEEDEIFLLVKNDFYELHDASIPQKLTRLNDPAMIRSLKTKLN
jgi:hypothetical protein